MAANFAKPISTDNYLDVLTTLRDNFNDLAKMLDGSTAANLPVGAIRWNSTTSQFEKYNGSTWIAILQLATQTVNGLLSAGDKIKIDDLGTAASTDKQTSVTDTTSGRLMIVGAFGWGTSAPSSVSSAGALDAVSQTRIVYVTSANVVTVNGPADASSRIERRWHAIILSSLRFLSILFYSPNK